MTTYYARKEYIYAGGDAVFSIPFSYIKKEHINVLIKGEKTENYTYLNATQIRITETLTTNDKVTILRTTPIDDRMVKFSNTSILEKDAQNLAQNQVFSAVQELYDNNDVFKSDTNDEIDKIQGEVDTANTNASSALTKANTAVSTANSADTKATNAVSTANTASTNAATAVSTANSATSTANAATTKANTAISTANSATTTANNAKETAEGIDAKATEALATANEAASQVAGAVAKADTAKAAADGVVETATEAKTIASTASTNASTALTTANTAKSTAEGIDTKATQALTKATTAETNAASAKTTAEGVDAKATQAQTDASTAKDNAATALSTAQSVQTALGGKQDTISDLATIRSGAAKGATAVQDVSYLQNQINYLQINAQGVCSEYLNFLRAGSTHTSLKIGANTELKFKLGSEECLYKNTADDEFSVTAKLDTGSLQAGKDYCVYIKKLASASTGFDFVVSLNGTYPTGYTASNTYKIGGFHTLCLAVTSSNAPALKTGSFWGTHPAIGYNTSDIIPNSVWCLTHRPVANPNGMVYVDRAGKWFDIYLQSGTFSGTASVYKGTTTDSRQPILHQFDMLCVYKEMMTDNDFMIASEGSNQQTNISGSADPVTTGGHIDTSSKRMISGYFLEDCCGALWQWLNELGFNGNTNWTGYGTNAADRGQSYGMPYVLLAGGNWDNGSYCGSWSRGCDAARTRVDARRGCRGVSRPLFLGKVA